MKLFLVTWTWFVQCLRPTRAKHVHKNQTFVESRFTASDSRCGP